MGHTRKGLTAHYEPMIDNVVQVKRKEAEGQFDLFGGMGDDSADEGPGFGLDVEFSDVEWDKTYLLAQEREMLGLYVSDHPLFGLEHVLSDKADAAIAQLTGGDYSDGSIVTIGGIISGLQRKMTKQGNAWAVITLADRDAAIEVLFFPAAYQLVQHALAEDNVISVTGRIEDRDGTVQLFGRELTVLDLSAAEHGGKLPVRLALPAHRITEQSVKELKRILADHPGDSPVHLSVRGPRKTTVYALQATVDPATLASEVKGTFGADAWEGMT